MAENDKISFSLDLDNKEFQASISESLKALKELGIGEHLKGLTESFTKVAAVAGSAALAMYALKAAVETVFEAENIKAVSEQFRILTENANLSGEALKKALTEAAGGLIDDTELLKSANKAIVAMGQSASKLPEILELSRKATQVFGGDLQSNFETLNQALATGQTRMLKQYGITVDNEKAVRNYAASIGVTVGSLSEAGKRQAIMNEALAQMKSRLSGVNGDLKEAQNTFQQFKVTVAQIGEAFTLAFEKIAGPTVRAVLKDLKELAEYAKAKVMPMLEEFGATGKRSSAQVNEELIKTRRAMNDLIEAREKFGPSMMPAGTDAEIERLRKRVQDLAAELDGTAKRIKEEENQPIVTGPAKTGADEGAVNRLEHRKQEIQFEKDLIALKQQRAQMEMQNATSVEEVDTLAAERKRLVNEEEKNRIDEINLKVKEGAMTREQADLEITEIHRQSVEEQKRMDYELDQQRQQALENYVHNSENAADGMARAFAAGSRQAQLEMNDFGKQGQRVFQNFSKHSTNALLDFGAGTKTASEAAKGFVMGMLADEAEARGKVMMLASVFPPNPLGLAAGAGLIALAGYLRSQAGGKAQGGAGSVTTGGGMTEYGTPQQGLQQSETQKKAVTIQVQGHYFETEQTKNRLMEMVRESTDATDFKYVQIGQT